MTTENWLAIAIVMATMMSAAANLFGPSLAVLAQSRISQPNPTPVDNQPKNLIQRIGGWLERVFMSPRTGIFLILLNLGVLTNEIIKPEPVTRGSVFLMIVCVSGIYSLIHTMTINQINATVLGIINQISELIDQISKLIDIDAKTIQLLDAKADKRKRTKDSN